MREPTSQKSPHLHTELQDAVPAVLPSPDPTLIFPFHLLPSPVNPAEFSFCFFSGFLVIFILFSSNNMLGF